MADHQSIVPLSGYSDRLSLRSGEKIEFKVSSTLKQKYSARLTRSISADPNPDGVGIIEENCDKHFSPREFKPRFQAFHPGSYAITRRSVSFPTENGFAMVATVWPTLRTSARQSVLSIGDITLCVDPSGCATLQAGNDKLLSSQVTMSLRQWYRLEASFEADSGTLTIKQFDLGNPAKNVEVSTHLPEIAFNTTDRVLVAAQSLKGLITNHYNGKIESPALYSHNVVSEKTLFAQWDFSQNTDSLDVSDIGGNQYDAYLVNFPTRAMTSSTWDASEMCWRHKPEQYAAIHFHDDDIYNFGWQTDFSFTIPEDLPSGIYVMRISCGIYEDAMPFYVCPTLFKPQSKVCVLIPTFTYVIYGNHARPDYHPDWSKRIKDWKAYPNNPAEYQHYGLSTYNYHRDGSGICHASHLRPLFNLRPGYITFGDSECSGLRHFQADSHLISWLHHQGMDYDILTDQELHEDGLSAVKDYDVVMTTTHPEYHTANTLDALQAYRDNGGNLLYLGGNGFYWRIARHHEARGLLEIRRAEDGIRAWAAEPGEYYNAFDGSYGGLWRRSGRPPQKLAGIGFSAQGEFHGSYYLRKNYDTALDWIFENIEDEILGDFGFSGNGAAGFELDRIDHDLGTPTNSVLLAQSENHGDDFILVPEEQLTHLTNIPGAPTQSLLRADMVYFDVQGGGSVFATGSITFCGSLPYNNFNNNISTLLANIIKNKST